MTTQDFSLFDAANFQTKVLTWYDQHGRKDLPWQHPITPYRVWVSEIMLQQTQVTTVIPYFNRFMNTFPTIEALAQSPLDQVLQHWAGLGYYARARNLHKAAQIIRSDYQGQFPKTVELISTLPGIGRSTAGAIAAISLGVPAPILDGNVKRVLSRLHRVPGWPGQTQVANQLWHIAEHYTEQHRTQAYTQAMMDLGATICTRTKPSCLLCPLQALCQAYKEGDPEAFPGRKPKTKKPVKSTWMLALIHQQQIYLYRRAEQGIWGGLWSLPEFPSRRAIEENLALNNLLAHSELTELTPFRHTFSHYHLDIHPIVAELTRQPSTALEANNGIWYNQRSLKNLGMAAPVTKLITTLNAEEGLPL